jgi:hypothetical protein
MMAPRAIFDDGLHSVDDARLDAVTSGGGSREAIMTEKKSGARLALETLAGMQRQLERAQAERDAWQHLAEVLASGIYDFRKEPHYWVSPSREDPELVEAVERLRALQINPPPLSPPMPEELMPAAVEAAKR